MSEVVDADWTVWFKRDREKRQEPHPLTEFDAALVRFLVGQGFTQRRIASLFDVDQRRIAEISTGVKWPDAELRGAVYLLSGEGEREWKESKNEWVATD